MPCSASLVSAPLRTCSSSASARSRSTSMPVRSAPEDSCSETSLPAPRARTTSASASGNAARATCTMCPTSSSTGETWLGLPLKMPLILTWPVIKLAAVSLKVSSMPAITDENETIRPLTAAMAAPRINVRRPRSTGWSQAI